MRKRPTSALRLPQASPLLLLQLLLLQLQVLAAVPAAGPAPSTPSAPSVSQQSNKTPRDVIEDGNLSVPMLLRKYGYPVETHVCMTEDGYVLTLHRIPHGRDPSHSVPYKNSKSPDPDREQPESLDKLNDDITNNRVRSIRDRRDHQDVPVPARARRRTSSRSSNATSRRYLRQFAPSTVHQESEASERSSTSPGDKTKRDTGRRAVLFLPGMMCSSAIYLLMGPKRSLGYIFADAGFDVWIGNPRGTRYSMGHVEIPPSDDKYWQFSWHEMGQFDVPAMIDYIIATTGQPSVPIVGHSMGSTMMMVMGAVRPEYAGKVAIHAALAPTAYLQHVQSPILKAMGAMMPTVSTLSGMLGLHGIRRTHAMGEFLKELCRDEVPVTQRLCMNTIFMLLGFDPEQFNTTMMPAIAGHFPSGGSTRILFHYLQCIAKGSFAEYDFGSKRNMLRYGQAEPPAYNLSKVDFPVALFTGENDWIIAMQDVERIARELPKVVDIYRVPWPKFNHMDHVFAIDAKELEYDHLIEDLRKFS